MEPRENTTRPRAPMGRGGRASRPGFWVSVGRPGVTDGENLPLMPLGLVPVDHPAAVFGVDAPVHRAAHRAPISDPGGFDAAEDRIEAGVVDPEAEVVPRKGFV